ncbi:MAG: PEP-CTERM/exosortase system-associated acyltransferase [Candidatus Omnitrophota bacterium]
MDMCTGAIGTREYVFDRVDINSEDFLREIYHQRYHVFCEECGILKREGCSGGLEKDKFDQHSIHFAALDRNELIGNARLVVHNPYGLPMIEHVQGNLSREYLDLLPHQVAEVSRLLISKRFRKRGKEKIYYPLSPEGTMGSEKQAIRRAKPVIMGLSREIYHECVARGVTHTVALMEKPLWYLLRVYGLNFRPIGDEIEYHGLVKPYICEVSVMGKYV